VDEREPPIVDAIAVCRLGVLSRYRSSSNWFSRLSPLARWGIYDFGAGRIAGSPSIPFQGVGFSWAVANRHSRMNRAIARDLHRDT